MTKPPDQKVKTALDASNATQTSELARSRLGKGDLLAGRYEIVRLLGVGAMGEVFEALDQHLDVTVAVKVLRTELYGSADALARFRQELLTARKVSHPNVIRLHDMVRDGDRWLLSMEYVDGQSLEARLTNEIALTLDAAVDLVTQLAHGLAAAHAAGVVHRDLKPANILLTDAGRATISDFGIARSLSHAGLTREGLIVGTPDYLSPEQAAGEPVDGRSDLYALGIILCEMLSGELPFNATTAQEAIGQRLAKSPTPLTGRTDIPPWLIEVCHRLLRRNVRRRYQNASEVLADLERQGRRESRSAWLPVSVAATVTLAAAGWAVYQWQDDSSISNSVEAAAVPAVAVLPALNAPDEQLARAVAGYISDQLTGAADIRIISPVRVVSVMELLQFEADAVMAHTSRIGVELAADQLIVPDWSASGPISFAAYSSQDQFAQPMAAPQMAGPLPELEFLAPAGGWSALADFYAGLVLLEQGNATDAVPVLTRATQQQPQAERNWWALARALESLGRNDAAQDAALQAGASAQGDGRYADLARAWQALATGNYDSSDALMQSLQDRFPQDSLILMVAAEYWGDGGDLRRAEQLLTQALEFDPESARGWFLLAKFSILQGESQRALDEYLVRAQTFHNRLRNRQGQADVVNAQGVAYEQLGQLEAAASAYSRAAETRSAIGDQRGEAATLRNLAAIEAVRGRLDLADQHWEQARALLEQLNDLAGMADLYNDAGVLAEERGAYGQALEHYRQALDLRRRLPNQRSVAESLGNVGYASLELGQFTTAKAYLEQALTLSETVGDQAGVVHAQQNLALLDMATGRLQEADRRSDSVNHVAESLQMRQELAVNQIIRAELRLSQGRFIEALTAANGARSSFSAQEDTRGQAETALVRTRIYLALGAYEKAGEILDSDLQQVHNADQNFDLTLLRAAVLLAAGDSAAAQKMVSEVSSDSSVSALSIELLNARIAGSSDAALWQQLVTRAESLAHWPLLLEVSRFAAAAAVVRGDLVEARGLFERRWPLAAEQPQALEKPLYAALTGDLCPVVGQTCEQWRSNRQQLFEQALAFVPKQFAASYQTQLEQP